MKTIIPFRCRSDTRNVCCYCYFVFLQAYLVETIRIQMGDSVRPQQMGVFKSTDGIAFTPWEYKVSLNSQCSAEFSVPSSTSVSQASSVLCTQYSINNQPRNEVVRLECIFLLLHFIFCICTKKKKNMGKKMIMNFDIRVLNTFQMNFLQS